jgi:hypothetical protein
VLRSSGRQGEGALAYLKIFFFGENKNKTQCLKLVVSTVTQTGTCPVGSLSRNFLPKLLYLLGERIASVNCLGCCGLFPRPLLPGPLSALLQRPCRNPWYNVAKKHCAYTFLM